MRDIENKRIAYKVHHSQNDPAYLLPTTEHDYGNTETPFNHLSNHYVITMLSSQDFRACPLLYPIERCCVNVASTYICT